ncbi:hypothetical protein MBLNU459_g6657t1 [Dothideomycetes sp. NU459]
MPFAGQKRKREISSKHPYLSGNFAPIHHTVPLTPCSYEGIIPDELAGGEYVRNGGNPVSNEDLGRDAHWFDGDGMLSGVSFRRRDDGEIEPEFVNQYILTDVYLSTVTSARLQSPILPSIATLVNPLSSLVTIILRIFRTILLVILSHLPGSEHAIKKISVANTALLFHDGRALATCESGPPMRIALPGLETVGWYNGSTVEGESKPQMSENNASFGGDGLLGFMREWTTAHPKVDPNTKEMMLFHSSFLPPYVHYSIVPEATPVPPEILDAKSPPHTACQKLISQPVPGISGAKMMHDFGVSLSHTIIMDLPLSLDPFNLAKNRPVIEYDATKPSRFGIFPRHRPDQVKFFETNACCIFHTANTWDQTDETGAVESVNMLACRLTSSSLVYSAGNIAAPQPTKQTVRAVKKAMPFFEKYDVDVPEKEPLIDMLDLESPRLLREPLIRMHSNGQIDEAASSVPVASEILEEDDVPAEEDQCRLYHYSFSLKSSEITSQYALSAIPFEFPSVRPDLEMQDARYIYGCSTTISSFGAALGRAVKIDALVKIDARSLIHRGEQLSKQGLLTPVVGCVDQRGVREILASNDEADPIRIFRMPEGWFAQEPRFVPRSDSAGEDDGWLVTYAFNEAQLNADGEVCDDADPDCRARSELWIIDAHDMKTLVGRVHLPQRVPYGLHGTWFSENEISGQRSVETIRTVASLTCNDNVKAGMWMRIRASVESFLS